MTWNYRIVKRRHDRDKETFALHEVYYDSEGRPWGMTVEPATFGCDDDEGAEGVSWALAQALADAIRLPVLDEPEKWPGVAPGSEST